MESDQTQSARTDLQDLKERIEEGVRKGQYTWREIQEIVMQKTRETAQTADDYVHDNPWNAVGIAAGLGLVLGLIMAPNSDR